MSWRQEPAKYYVATFVAALIESNSDDGGKNP